MCQHINLYNFNTTHAGNASGSNMHFAVGLMDGHQVKLGTFDNDTNYQYLPSHRCCLFVEIQKFLVVPALRTTHTSWSNNNIHLRETWAISSSKIQLKHEHNILFLSGSETLYHNMWTDFFIISGGKHRNQNIPQHW